MIASGYQDVDAVITTRELAALIKDAGIDFINLPDENADKLVGTFHGGLPPYLVPPGELWRRP